MLEAGGFSRLLKFAESWKAPEFPLKGGDLLTMGAKAGPNVGQLLKSLENEWVDSGFALERGALLERAAQILTG
jgi:tRNA nucleotidyltransferase/poly(A) polymerase